MGGGPDRPAGPSSARRRWPRRCAVLGIEAACVVAMLWCVLAWGNWRVAGAWGAVLAVLAAGFLAAVWLRGARRRRRAAIVLGFWLLTLVAWRLDRPLPYPRVAELARWPEVAFDGARCTIANVRDARHRAEGPPAIRWETRDYDLATVERCDLLIEPFSAWRGLAHAFVSFGFADGRHLAISVEIVRRPGEEYHPVAGAFHRYDLHYVVADERDVIGLRALVRENPLYCLPVRAEPERLRAVLRDLLRHADRLAEHPEFYDTVTASCSSSLRRHVQRFRADPLPRDWRVLFPGYLDEYAAEAGLLAVGEDYPAGREAYRIDGRVAEAQRRFADDGAAWSAWIRAGIPEGGE